MVQVNTTQFSFVDTFLSMDPWTRERVLTPAGFVEYALASFITNTAVFILFFGSAYAAAYPGGLNGLNSASVERWRPFKFNPKYPSRALVSKEVLRSWTSVAIVSILDAGITSFIAATGDNTGQSFRDHPGSLFPRNAPGWIALLTIAIAYILFADAHFYWTHRLLHGELTYTPMYTQL